MATIDGKCFLNFNTNQIKINTMRKIIVLEFITLDGVMQAPGGPEEDTSGSFEFGGWSAPYGDEVSGKLMKKQMEPADLLLGRKTFEIFASFWPCLLYTSDAADERSS